MVRLLGPALVRLVSVVAVLIVVGSISAATTSTAAAAYAYDLSAIARVEVNAHAGRAAASPQAAGLPGWFEVRSATAANASTTHVASVVATNALDDLAEVGFRSDTSHIFRDAPGHLAADTAENRALIQSALSPENLRTTITLPDGSTLAQYFRTLPDGTQVWVEVRNGLEITNGNLNVIPR